jgi:hypothetical protein
MLLHRGASVSFVVVLALAASTAAPASEPVKLAASDATASDYFGCFVAIDGDTALVGAYYDDDSGINSGSAYVFTRSGATWTQQSKLTAADGAASDYFGFGVALWGDTALVGARFGDGAASNSGSVYVFTRSGELWTQQAELNAIGGATGDNFGNAVALWGDTALVGAYGDDDAGYESGSAYVFVRTGTTWEQQAKFVAADGATYDGYGASVALLGDTALVGARFADSAGGTNQGAAYVYNLNGADWTEEAKLTAADATDGDSFGVSVALSGDAALVGANGDDDAGDASGSAYVFELVAACEADFNLDGVVDGMDLTFVLARWGTSDAQTDLNGDGIVDGMDLAGFLASWGGC